MSEAIGNAHNYLCPNCKKGDMLEIEIKVWATLVHDGTDIEGQDHGWDENNQAACKNSECRWQGKVADFITLQHE